jgi:hypothetical protein
MRFFMPRFKIAAMMPAQDRLLSKIGGLPWGLPQRLWPRCCGKPQKLLAQFCHEPQILDLGSVDAVLHLFQCMECLGIGYESGCAAFIAERVVLGDGLTRIEGCELPGDLGDGLIGEAWIDGWDEEDDGIPESRLGEFFSEKSVWAIQDEFPDVDWFDGRRMTRFGGTPRWTGNGPMSFPPPPFEFLLQLNNGLYMPGTPPSPDVVGCDVYTYTYSDERVTDTELVKPQPSEKRPNAPWLVAHERSSSHYEFEFTNLGTDGTLFVFIDRARKPHVVRWFWNR